MDDEPIGVERDRRAIRDRGGEGGARPIKPDLRDADLEAGRRPRLIGGRPEPDSDTAFGTVRAPLSPATTRTGAASWRCSRRAGFGVRSGQTTPSRQKLPSFGMSPKSPP